MIHFITGNQNKLKEVRAILGEGKVEHLDIDLPEIQEIDAKKILQAKLLEARKHHKGELIVEDTSFYLECLSWSLPGPLIKWFMKSLGIEGIAEIAAKYGVHGATVTNLLGYMDIEGNIEYFIGSVHGSAVYPRGERSFGWDPIFQPNGYIKTFAELSDEEKNEISHRKIALEKLKIHLDSKK
ncbi:MAG: non-canonical purine NTP pyrophosphatase [bacterium]